MDKRFHKILEDLKSSSYRQVYNALVEVRTLLQTHRPTSVAQKLRKTGITKLLVRFLQKKYEKLIYLTLSILGTCCLELETRVMLQQAKLPYTLISIQSEFNTDSIQSRICRCIGNLAALPAAAADFHEAGIVPILVTIIKPADSNHSTSETKQMAVRALRVLGDTGEHRQELLKEDAVKVIADQLTSSDEDIVKASLKTLVSFCSSIEGAVQVQRGVSGTGFEQLVTLARSGPKPDLALLCLCTLAHAGSCRPDLGKAGAITVIFEELKKQNYKSEPRTLITALCLFCSEIVNRVRIRDNNHLPDLLDLYRSARYSYLHDVLLIGLIKYLYDDMSLKVMLDNGLVPALMYKLRQHIRSLSPTHHESSSFSVSTDFSRRMSVDSESDPERSPSWQLPFALPEVNPRFSPYLAGPSSPRRSPGANSPASSSMSLSPPRSPLPSTSVCWSPAYSTSSGMTETYSPVYGEDSSGDDDCESLLEQDVDASRVDGHREEEERHSYMIHLFLILTRIANFDWGIADLMTSSSVNTLLAYLVIGRLYISKAALILVKIISKSQFLLPLVHQRFALQVFSRLCLRRHEGECSACSVHHKIGTCLLDKAAVVAEGPYSEGELAYLLQKGKQEEIRSTALSIPFVIRTCWLLKKLLVTHRGLPVILELVSEEAESSQAIMALSCLARSLKFSYNKPSSIEEELFPDYQPRDPPPSKVVTFLLDDGSEVQADKLSLGEASQVFNSMLNGKFRESKENVVKLQEISKETLILLLIYCNSYLNNNEVIIGKPEVTCVLDLFVVSDKFLITDLNSKLLDYTKFKYFNVDHFVNLYKWCDERVDLMVTAEVGSLFEDACAFLLVGPMKHKRRVQIFSALMQAGMWERMKSCLSSNFTQRMEQGDFE